MKRIYVNEKYCLGCKLCEYNCAFANSGESDMVIALKGKKIMPKVKVEENQGVSFAVSCRHCDEPKCITGCIGGALTKNADGVVVYNSDKCVGCKSCILLCPFGAVFSYEDKIISKCELCTKNSAKTPQCVEHCPNNAIVFEERE